jgi:hypothetical protein
MANKSSSLDQGVERLNKVVRDVHERQHELSGTKPLEGPAPNPKDAWARKHASEGFGPEAAATAALPGDKPSAHQQAQFMRELKAKMGENHGKHAQTYGKLAMQKPFSPGKGNQPKRSMWSRMTRGS